MELSLRLHNKIAKVEKTNNELESRLGATRDRVRASVKGKKVLIGDLWAVKRFGSGPY
jgi:hypothetical protein